MQFVRPQVTGKALLQRGVPDVVEVTLPLRGPDDEARVVIDRPPVDGFSAKEFIQDTSVVTVRLNEQELEFIAQAYLSARQERDIERALPR